jgi:Txe/YoeB family toxin of Txe-Axe toxin-antitoxin module
MKKIWFDEAWQDYLYWQTQDKKTLKRINALIQDIERSGFDSTYLTMTSLIAELPSAKCAITT